MKKRYSLFSTIMVLALSGCATYHISVISLERQLRGTETEMKGNLFLPVDNIRGNSLATITVLDKQDRPHTIPVTGHTGVRITQKSGKRKTFYFDTLQLTDSTITGSTTHLFNAAIKPIFLDSVRKIELQK